MAKFDRRVIKVHVGGEPAIVILEGDEVSLVRFKDGREQYYSNKEIKKC